MIAFLEDYKLTFIRGNTWRLEAKEQNGSVTYSKIHRVIAVYMAQMVYEVFNTATYYQQVKYRK